MAKKAKQTKKVVPWQPDRVLTEADAQKLTIYLTAKAERDIAKERDEGSDYPKLGTPAYEACVAELAYRYSQNWVDAGEASQLQITDWMARDSLYLHHPRQWETLEEMLQDIARSMSQGGRSVYTRLAEDVLPYLRRHEIAEAVDLMAIVMEPDGGKSKLYHAMPMITEAIGRNKKRVVRALINDIKNPAISRRQLMDKWQKKVPIPPASAELRKNGDGLWHLSITMDEQQKRLILARLQDRVAYNESPYPASRVLERLYPEDADE